MPRSIFRYVWFVIILLNISFAKPAAQRFPLHDAVKEGTYQEVRELLEEGRDPDRQDWSGKTPLHWAARSGLYEKTKLLVRNGANVFIQENDGCRPLDCLKFTIAQASVVEMGVQLIWLLVKDEGERHVPYCRWKSFIKTAYYLNDVMDLHKDLVEHRSGRRFSGDPLLYLVYKLDYGLAKSWIFDETLPADIAIIAMDVRARTDTLLGTLSVDGYLSCVEAFAILVQRGKSGVVQSLLNLLPDRHICTALINYPSMLSVPGKTAYEIACENDDIEMMILLDGVVEEAV